MPPSADPRPTRILAPDADLCLADVPLKAVRRHFVSEHYVMVLVTRGHGIYLDESTQKRHPITTGDIMQRFPGRAHSQFFASTDNRQFFLKVPATLYYLLHGRGLLNPACVLSMRTNALVLFERCYAACQALDDADACLWRIKDLILALHRRARPASAQDEVMLQAQQLLQSQGNDRLALPALAARLSMSYAHFRRRFRQQTGLAPGAWLIRQRLERACQFLQTDGVSISDISAMLRYPDVASFSKQFKKAHGVPPTVYRERAGR